MSSINQEHKLAHKLILSAIAAFLVSTALFLILQSTTGRLIYSYCAKPEVVSAHLEKKADSLRQYIRSNDIALSEIDMLDSWLEKEDLTKVAVYRDNVLLYTSSRTFPELSSRNAAQNHALAWNNGYTLTFRDGEATALINDLFEHRYKDYATYLNLLAFFLCFIAIMILFIRKKVSYINTLEQEIRVLEGGDLHYAISVKGNDELASLAQEIDEMRKAFIAREQYAERMRAASNKLVTGISHDLRTPLTALIGYLEVMEGEETPAGQSPFLPKCKNRALQIKSLISNLFEYFFVTMNGDEQLELTSCPIKHALDEIIKEYVFLMAQSGFAVTDDIKLPVGTVQIDHGMVQRIFDNLLSNIQRYADPTYPVRLGLMINPQELILTIQNHVLSLSETSQSTGLGLKVCDKIMSLHRGRFLYRQQGSTYTVELHFPYTSA